MKKTLFAVLIIFAFILIFTACDTPEPPEESIVEASDISEAESVPENSLPEDSVPDESLPETSEPDVSEPEVSAPDVSMPDVSMPDVSVPETSELEETSNTEKSVWYDDEELDQWFAELKNGIDEYEPREEITSDGMRSDHFTIIPGFFSDYIGSDFYFDYIPKFGACGDANIAALAEYYDISKEEYVEFCRAYLEKWGKAPYGEKPDGLELYMLNWDAWFSEEYWNHPDFIFSDYDSEKYDCYYTSVPDRNGYTRRYYRIDYALIQYVGEEQFNKWLEEKEDTDQNILDFIEYFNITREQYDSLYKDYFPLPYNPDYLFGTAEMQEEYFKVHPLNKE